MHAGGNYLQMDYFISSVCGMRNDFQKADDQEGNSFAKSRVSRDWNLLSENSQMVAEKLRFSDTVFTRTRLKVAYLGVLCWGAGGRFSCKKEPPGLPCGAKETIFLQKGPPRQLLTSCGSRKVKHERLAICWQERFAQRRSPKSYRESHIHC